MSYCVINALIIGEIGINGVGYNATRPTELRPSDYDAEGRCVFSLVDLSDQPLHFIDTSQYDVALEDGLTVDDIVLYGTIGKGIAFDKTCAYIQA
jgi:hypothetical protein